MQGIVNHIIYLKFMPKVLNWIGIRTFGGVLHQLILLSSKNFEHETCALDRYPAVHLGRPADRIEQGIDLGCLHTPLQSLFHQSCRFLYCHSCQMWTFVGCLGQGLFLTPISAARLTVAFHLHSCFIGPVDVKLIVHVFKCPMLMFLLIDISYNI